MASVSVMQLEPAQTDFARSLSPPFMPDKEYGCDDLHFASADPHQNHAQKSHAPWGAGYSSGYLSSSSNPHSPPVHTRSQSLDIDEAVGGENSVVSGWNNDRKGAVNGWSTNRRESATSGWSNDREGAVSGWSNRREYSSFDNYHSHALTLLPLHHLHEGSYSRLDRSVSTTPPHSRQPSRASSQQSVQSHTHSDRASHQCRPSHDHLSQGHASQGHASHLSQGHASHLSQGHASHLSQGHASNQTGLPNHPLHRHSTSTPPFRGNSSCSPSHEHAYTPHSAHTAYPAHTSDPAHIRQRSHPECLPLPHTSPDVPPRPHHWNHAPHHRQPHPQPQHARQHSADAVQRPPGQFPNTPRPQPEGCSLSTPHPPPSRRPKSVAASDEALLAQVLDKLEEVDVDVKRWVVKADQHLQRSEYREAIPYVEAVIVRMQPYHRLQLLLWELLGNTHMAVSNWKKASICHLHHLGYSRALKDFKSVTRAECNLGISYMKLDLLKLAGRCFLQYLKNCKSLRDEWGVQAACSNLGVLSKLAAIRAFEAAGKCGGEAKKREGEMSARAKLNSGLLKAIIFFKQHLEVVLDYGDIDMQSRAYGNIGSCYELLRDYSEAIHYHRKRLELARATGDLHSESCTLCHLGNCLRAKGNYEEAVEYYQMNLEMAQSVEDGKMEQILHFNLGLTYEKMKQPHQAIVHYTLYLGMVVQCDPLQKQVRGFSVLARLYVETGQLCKAQEFYHNLVGIFKKLGDKASMDLAEMKARSLLQLIKQEKKKAKKKKDGRISYSPPVQPSVTRSKGRHTISRATNIHRELDHRYSGEEGWSNAQERSGHSWGGTRRATNTVRHASNTTRCAGNTSSSIELQNLRPKLDSPPTSHHQWRTHQEVGYEAVNFSLDSHTSEHAAIQYSCRAAIPSNSSPLVARATPPPTHVAQSHDHSLSLDGLSPHNNEVSFSSYGGPYDHLADNTTDNLTSVTSASLDNLDPMMPAELSVFPSHTQFLDHTHFPNHTQLSRSPEEVSNDDSSTLYETISSPSHVCLDDLTEGHSTGLPSLSYLSSTVSLGVGEAAADLAGTTGHVCGEEDGEEDDEISMRYYEELKQAGLELARVGLDLAGYEGLVGLNGLDMEQGADKEWEQWQEMREEEIRGGVAFGSSGHSTLQRRTKLKKALRPAGSAPSLVHRAP